MKAYIRQTYRQTERRILKRRTAVQKQPKPNLLSFVCVISSYASFSIEKTQILKHAFI